MTEYIIVPKTEPLPNNIDLLRQISDEEWKNHILSYLMQYCDEVNKNEVAIIISKEKEKNRSNIESVLKQHIKNWFKENNRFLLAGFKIDREPHSEGAFEGYYDFKFQHSYWKHYFPFECKNIEAESKSKLTKSTKEYIYQPPKNGGVYRYLIKKYSPDQNFGGMIGFLLSGNIHMVVDNIIKKLEVLDISDKHLGKLTASGIKRNSIADNKNTFNSSHNCYDLKEEAHSTVLLHHIIIDFQIH